MMFHFPTPSVLARSFLILSLFLFTTLNSTAYAANEDDDFLLLVMPAIIAAHQMNQYDPNNPHASIKSWQGTVTCLKCHQVDGEEVFHSIHYQWLGNTPYMTDGPMVQGKLDVGVNSYCINTTGNWNGCGNCHAGLGARPESTLSQTQLENIDCLTCHQDEYKRKKVDGVFIPDTEAMNISMKVAAQTVHLPTRTSCLICHAKGGGGDNFKRGDMALAHGNTADRNFDVHMATSGADLTCQSCHTTENHRMAGRGSDLRPTDLDVEMTCFSCHEDKETLTGHSNSSIGKHVARVACQSCHIPVYAKNAFDTPATEETEVHRDWQTPHQYSTPPIHPQATMAGDLTPRYRWWTGFSKSYLLYDTVPTPIPGTITTSEPEGAVNSTVAKIYPFKYKTAHQPLDSSANQLIALDTSVYFATGDYLAATRAGLVNMGRDPSTDVSWVTTDTYQLITHEVAPANQALRCNDCHNDGGRMDLTGSLGYGLKGPRSQVCIQCHETKDGEDKAEYIWIHKEHVDEENIDCSLCHSFTRPERGLNTSVTYSN